MATSDYNITRSNAFRNLSEHHNEAILNSPEELYARANHKFEKSIRSVSENLLTLLDTPAQHRCPTPLSPAQVDLNQVNILSQVLPVQQDATHPVSSDAWDDLASIHEHLHNNPRSSRSTNQPRSYMVCKTQLKIFNLIHMVDIRGTRETQGGGRGEGGHESIVNRQTKPDAHCQPSFPSRPIILFSQMIVYL